eukprot:1604743-Lingulodinium_polyedra.AAC.1
MDGAILRASVLFLRGSGVALLGVGRLRVRAGLMVALLLALVGRACVWPAWLHCCGRWPPGIASALRVVY